MGTINGSTATYQVNVRNHNNETGHYNTHVYLTDKNGKQYMVGGDITVPSQTNINAALSYTGHVQNIGWQSWVSDGEKAGTSGQSLRIEGLKIKVTSSLSGSIEYRTHVQNIGWQSWVRDGALAGTSGKSLRLEAMNIRLTGELEQYYHVEYRTHVQNIGWQSWVRDGAMAGTSGKSLRLEALQIRLVRK